MGGILVFSLETSEPTLHVLVGLQKYRKTTSNEGSPLCGKDFAFVNDVKNGQAALTCFCGEYLEVVAKTGSNVLEAPHMETLLGMDTALELITVVDDDAAWRETVMTRGAMWCPPELVTLVLKKKISHRIKHI